MIVIHLIETELIAIKFGNKSVPQSEIFASIGELIKIACLTTTKKISIVLSDIFLM